MLVFHKLSELYNVGHEGSAMRSMANSLLTTAETRIVCRQESDQLGPTATARGLTGTEQATVQANCETRLLPGQQAKAFTAAALPLYHQV